MPSPINTMTKIWKRMKSKVRRDSYVAAHISNTVASQILMLREAKGWTQMTLAQKSGMQQSRISALEDPNYENFQAATLRRLASAFDVALTIRFIPFSELAGWTATLSPDKLAPVDFERDGLQIFETQGGTLPCDERVTMNDLLRADNSAAVIDFQVASADRSAAEEAAWMPSQGGGAEIITLSNRTAIRRTDYPSQAGPTLATIPPPSNQAGATVLAIDVPMDTSGTQLTGKITEVLYG